MAPCITVRHVAEHLSPKTFRFNDDERALIARLQGDLHLASEADVVRFGLAALRGLLRDGLTQGTHVLPDGTHAIRLDDEIRGRFLRLSENADGSFSLAWRGGRGDEDTEDDA